MDRRGNGAAIERSAGNNRRTWNISSVLRLAYRQRKKEMLICFCSNLNNQAC